MQQIKEESFDAIRSHGTKDVKQGIVLCLGGMLAFIRGAKAEETCGAEGCQMQKHGKMESETESETDWLKVTLIVMTVIFLIGGAIGWRLRSWWGFQRSVQMRSVKTQSQTKYNGRFIPLHDRDQGVWLDWQNQEVQERMIPMQELMQGRREL